ncbi:hypothetical protein [Amycolatopsis taiwanensis]|uniref:hypothetical protein n=1 Tax=Amycolatopsis taiwanensis TaxID=342230 RepID=UPI0004822988|nr:hypothetical protein [Amycolatopsis taiwanensis]
MSAQQIYDNFINAKGPGDLTQAQVHLVKVMSTYQDRAQQITSLAASMEEGWSGDASQAAQGSAARLSIAHDKAAMHMVEASQLIDAQSQAFYDTKNRVVPVPEVPKAPSFVDTVITMGSANTTYQTKVEESLAAGRQNVQAMDGWTTTSNDNGARMPSSYGNLDPGALNVSMTSPSSAPSVGGGGAATIPGGGGGATGHGPGGGGYAPGGGGYSPPAGTGTPQFGLPPNQNTSAQGYVPPPVTRTPSFPGPISGPNGGPPRGGLDGWPPVSGTLGPDTTDGYRSGTGSPRGGPGGGPGGGSAGRGADRLYGGAPGEKGIGAGNRVGAGAPGSPNGPGGGSAGRAGSAPAGAAGRPGASGMGGAHGGKGNGEEDAEHQRKYILDDDEAFQLTAEGERLVDPVTGLPVTPPVIG